MFALTQITKQQVDSYSPGQIIPSCILRAEWTEQSNPSRLIHKVTLKGAKEPFNFLNIVLGDIDSIQPGIQRRSDVHDHVNRVSDFVAGQRKLAGRSNRN